MRAITSEIQQSKGSVRQDMFGELNGRSSLPPRYSSADREAMTNVAKG